MDRRSDQSPGGDTAPGEETRQEWGATAWGGLSAFAVAYFLAAVLGGQLSFQPLHFVVLWLPSGLLAAVLLCSPMRRWPLFLLAAALANVAFDLANGQRLITSLGFVTANCLEAVSGAWLVNRLVPRRPRDHMENRELLVIIGASAVVGPAIGAAVGATVVWRAFGVTNWLGTWLTWWSADGLSVVALGVLLVSAHRSGRGYWHSLTRARMAEFAAALACLAVLCVWVFSSHDTTDLKFILMPVLLWVGIRFRLVMVGFAGLVLSTLVVFFAVHVTHGFDSNSAEVVRHLQAVQSFLATSLASIMLLTSTLNARREAEAALRASEQRLSFALDATSDGLWDWDLPSGQTYFSPRYYTMLGYAPGEFPGSFEAWRGMLHPDDREAVLAEIDLRLKRGEAFEVEFRLRTKSGAWKWILGRGMVVEYDASGAPVRMVGTHVDIDSQKEIAKALRESEERYRSLFMSQMDAFALHEVVLDGEGRLVDFRYLAVNPAFERLLGRPAEEIVGHTVLELLPDTEPYWMDAYARVALGGEALHLESHSAQLGRHFEVSAYSPARGQYAVVARDVSDRVRAREELRAAKVAAEAASRSKSEFLATMSHEIRTPLNGVLGMLQLLGATELEPEQAGFVEIAAQSGRSLLRVLSDVLDISKIEAGALDIVAVRFDLDEVLEPIAQAFTEPAQDHGPTFACEADPWRPGLRGDAGRIRQVLYNLVGNAMKYTERGEVRLEAFLAEAEYPGAARLHLFVSDTGIGVPQAKLGDIFEVFTQVDGSYTRQYGGTGLGLAIVRRLVGLMGGEIEFCSREGLGTEVHVALPVALDERATVRGGGPAAGAPRVDLGALDVLLAEDDPVNRLTVTHMLTKAGHSIRAVGTGAEALEALRERVPDCVLMDIQMPEMDGLEATRRIRAGEAGSAAVAVPVIALTAHAMSGDKEIFLAAGVDAYLSKPVDMAELLVVLADIVAPAAPR